MLEIDTNRLYNMRSQVIGSAASEDKEELFDRALCLTDIWFLKVDDADILTSDRRSSERECYNFVCSSLNQEARPVGFFSGIIWYWVMSGIVKWIVYRIFDQIFPRK